jgi:hypothetical protein
MESTAKRMANIRVMRGKTRIQYVRYVRRQEVSDGWSVAQVKEWIRGWAGDVMGEIEARLLGRVVLFGNRIGDVNGLKVLAARLYREERNTYG